VLAIALVVAIAGNPPPGPSVLWASLAGPFGAVGLPAAAEESKGVTRARAGGALVVLALQRAKQES
jgi:hypothetical protein